jgi:hypothetical protein
MGPVVVAPDGILPGLTWFRFASSQFPIHLSPRLHAD